MKKIQPAVPAFLAVAISFAVQGDWASAFCRQFFLPRSQSSRIKPNWMQPKSESKQKIDWNLILNALYVFRFNSNCVFLCFLFLFFFSLLFSVKTKRYWVLNQIKSWLWTYIILNSIYFMFDLSFLLPSFPFLVPSFFLLFLELSFLFYVPLSFLIIKVFQFSDNLSDNLATTFG